MSCPILFDGDESDLSPLTDTDFSESDDSDFELEKPAPKRRRISKAVEKRPKKDPTPKKRRGYKGALQEIWTLPLDITYEIFGHLCPLDLLHLARTNKELRRTLMSRSSTSAWMQARSNVPAVPECPFDMSEPQFASLLFEPFCHYCSSNNVQTIIWEARIRCCKRCGPSMFQFWVNILDVPDVIQTIVPSTHEFSTGAIYPHTEKKYSTEVAIDLAKEMEKLTEDEKPLWFWNQKKQFDRRVEHADLCREWVRGQSTRRGQELNETRLKRTLQIIEKLGRLGWVEEMTKMSSALLIEHKHVKIPKELTERAWRKIEGEMIEFMEEVRSKRLTKERGRVLERRCNLMKEMYAAFLASQPLNAIMPGIADFATIPELKAVLQEPDLDTPVNLEDFQIGTDAMLEFSRQWREEKDNELVGILRQSSLGPTASKEDLYRASTLFNCKTCSVPISYPRILVHTCNVSRTLGMPDPSTVFERLKSEPWNLGGDRISFHEAAHQRAKIILKALKLGSETTFEEMKALNPFIECTCALCTRSTPEGFHKTFARWEYMIEHTPRYTSIKIMRPYAAVYESRQVVLERAEAHELQKIRRDPDWGDYSYRSYCCMHCNQRDTRNSIQNHIRTKHNTHQPVFDTDYTYHLDARVSLRAPTVVLKFAKSSSAKSTPPPVATTTDLTSSAPLTDPNALPPTLVGTAPLPSTPAISPGPSEVPSGSASPAPPTPDGPTGDISMEDSSDSTRTQEASHHTEAGPSLSAPANEVPTS